MAKEHKNLVFVCMAGINRSKTFEVIFKQRLKKDKLDREYRVYSFGVEGEGKRRLKKEYIKSADFIAVMDGMTSLMVERRFPTAKEKMDRLSIPDVYPREDETLVNLANWYYNQGVWKYF